MLELDLQIASEAATLPSEVQFRAWCERQGLRQPGRLMLGMGQDKRHVTPPEELRDIN